MPLRRWKSRRSHARPRRWLVLPLSGIAIIASTFAGWRLTRNADEPDDPQPRHASLLARASRPLQTVRFEEGCATSGCHSAETTGGWVHAAIACQDCHESDTGGHIFPVKDDAHNACAGCHDATTTHAHDCIGFRTQDCLACHQPHRSAAGSLTKRLSRERLCADCHSLSTRPALHHAVAEERCEICHTPGTADMPSIAGTKVGSPERCAACHAAEVSRFTGTPAEHRDATGGCTMCHREHVAGSTSRTAQAPGAACVECHAQSAHAFAAVASHAFSAGDRCLTCHEPHGSDHRAMTRLPEPDLCMNCHEKPATTQAGRTISAVPDLSLSPHGPAQSVRCHDCHDVHGSGMPALLAVPDEPARSRPHSGILSALCFSCHDDSLAEPAGPTGFRDGTRNLHHVHLASERQPHDCGSCHQPHASDQPHLLARSARFQGSEWMMTLQFQALPEGGRCSSSCHEPLVYSRAGAASRSGGAP